MREQIAHLLKLGEHPNVTIRVVERESGENLGLDGSFRLFTIDGTEVCYVEAPERGRLVMEPSRVQRFALRYDHLSNVAASRGPSRELLARAMESYQ